MIERLSGTVARRTSHGIVLDVNGVGYSVEMSLADLCDIDPAAERVTLWIDTHVREDAIRLFGFLSYEDKQAFHLLRSVSGIGPKIALAVLSTMDCHELRSVVLQREVHKMEAVPGIGKRTAEKLMLELTPKMEKMSFLGGDAQAFIAKKGDNSAKATASQRDELLQDVQSALENLGYKEKEIQPVLRRIPVEENSPFQSLLKSALRELRSNV
jgi:Holliday junction DNA helicase RuvA